MYLVSPNYERSLFFRTEPVALEMVKRNRLKRLDAARAYLEEYFKKQIEKCKNKKEKARYVERLRRMKKRYETEKKELKELEISPEQKRVLYQNCVEEKKKLMDAMKTAYSVGSADAEVAERRFEKGQVTLKHADEGTGVVLLGGNVLDSGRTEEGMASLKKTLKKVSTRKRGRGEENESSALSMEDMEKKVEELIAAEPAREEEMWMASTQVDLRRKKKKESIQSVCRSIASETNYCPYVPMTSAQYNALFALYTRDSWREILIRNPQSEEDVLLDASFLRQLFPDFTSPFICSLLMTRDVSANTLRRILCQVEGKAMTMDEEVESIGAISDDLLRLIMHRQQAAGPFSQQPVPCYYDMCQEGDSDG